MNEPLFLSDDPPSEIPGLIEYKLDEIINIPEEMIPWINYSLMLKSESFDKLYAIGTQDFNSWRNYFRIYGNGELLWQGDLPYAPANVIPGDLTNTYFGWDIQQRPGIGNEWRAKYRDDFPGGFWALWKPGFPLQYRANGDIFSFGFPDENTNRSYGYLPDYPPEPPDYPPAPTYSTVRMTKNMPDAEAFKDVSGIKRTYSNQSIIKIDDNKYKLFVSGKIYYLGTPVVLSTVNFQVVEGIWQAEQWERIDWFGASWKW
jgi:hypothetical protein